MLLPSLSNPFCLLQTPVSISPVFQISLPVSASFSSACTQPNPSACDSHFGCPSLYLQHPGCRTAPNAPPQTVGGWGWGGRSGAGCSSSSSPLLTHSSGTSSHKLPCSRPSQAALVGALRTSRSLLLASNLIAHLLCACQVDSCLQQRRITFRKAGVACVLPPRYPCCLAPTELGLAGAEDRGLYQGCIFSAPNRCS